MNRTGVQRTGCTGLLARNLAVVKAHAIANAQIAGRTHVVGTVAALIELDRDAIAGRSHLGCCGPQSRCRPRRRQSHPRQWLLRGLSPCPLGYQAPHPPRHPALRRHPMFARHRGFGYEAPRYCSHARIPWRMGFVQARDTQGLCPGSRRRNRGRNDCSHKRSMPTRRQQRRLQRRYGGNGASVSP